MRVRLYSQIKRLRDFCSTKRGGTVLAVSIVIVFFALSILRNYSFKTFADVLSDTGNDWSAYAQHGLSIVQGGLLMPSGQCPYASPSAFLYNYFIALCLTLFGTKLLPILILQHVMLGCSIALTYWTFRDKLNDRTAVAFLFALFLFGLLDVYKYYSAMLLSENLALFTLSLFFFFFVKGFEKRVFVFEICAALLLGSSILIRPNLVIFAIFLIPIVGIVYSKRKYGSLKFFLFILALLASSSLLLIRNYLACKKPVFFPAIINLLYFKEHNPIPSSANISTTPNLLYIKLYLQQILQDPGAFFKVYSDKILFCLGFLPVLCSAYRPRPHWMIMWAGYFTYLFLRIRGRERLEMWEASAHLYIFCYYGSLIMSTAIHNYGFRMLILGTNLVLLFSFMAFDRLRQPVKVRL